MQRRYGYIGAITALFFGAALARAQSSFDTQSQVATSALSNIDTRVSDIEALKAQASKDGQGVKLSCIEERLKRAKANAAAGKIVLEGWSLGASNPAYAQRSIDRLMLMQVYSMVYADEARACTNGKAPKGLEVKVDKSVVDSGKDVLQPLPGPRLERPPLASPY